MAKLSGEEQLTAKAWLNDFFVLSEFVPESKDKRLQFDTEYEYMQNSQQAIQYGQQAAKDILSEVRKHNFVNLNAELRKMTKLPFGDRLDSHFNVVYATESTLAGFIAWFCAATKVYWDDLGMFGNEKDAFEKSIFGQALKAFGALKSQNGVPSNEDWPIVTKIYIADKPAAGEKGTHRHRQGLPPKDDYKSSGPQSGNARGLVGNPGEKVYPKDPDGNLYIIAARHDFAHKNLQAAFIRPLKPEGATDDGKSNKVYFGSCNGYRECIIFFDDLATADDVFEKLRKAGGEKPELKDAQVYSIPEKKVDKNGYFKMSTEYGDAYIRASKFNEELEGEGDETIVEAAEPIKREKERVAYKLDEGGYAIDPIAFSKMGHLSDN